MNIGLASLEEVKARTASAFRGEPQGTHFSFASLELLWKALSPKRIELLQAMVGGQPMSIREAARRVGRDVKAVHGDVQALLLRSILKKTDDGRIVFPYDELRLQVIITAPRAAA